MIRHDEHASIVLVRRGAIENALTEEHGQRRWLRKLIDDTRAPLEALILRVLVRVQIEQELRDGVGILRSR